MTVNGYLTALVEYGLKTGLIQDCDRTYIVNQLLMTMGLDSYEEEAAPSMELEDTPGAAHGEFPAKNGPPRPPDGGPGGPACDYTIGKEGAGKIRRGEAETRRCSPGRRRSPPHTERREGPAPP